MIQNRTERDRKPYLWLSFWKFSLPDKEVPVSREALCSIPGPGGKMIINPVGTLYTDDFIHVSLRKRM